MGQPLIMKAGEEAGMMPILSAAIDPSLSHITQLKGPLMNGCPSAIAYIH